MQTKKIISIALTAALVSSVAAVATVSSVSAASALPSDFTTADLEGHELGIIGSFNDWSADVAPMADADNDGIYVGVVKDLPAGDYQFKVRLDGAWDDTWGMYDEENDRTYNGYDDNLNLTVSGESSDLIVMLDTTGEDGTVWPVSFVSTESAEKAAYSIVGDMTGWAGDAETAAASDIPMYEIKAGKYVGIIKGVTDTQGFKVRDYSANPDNVWQDSWGVYDAENDRTHNGFEDNCTVELGNSVADIVVEFDTTTVDPAAAANPDSEVNADGFDLEQKGIDYWPVSYQVVTTSTGDVPTDPSTGESTEPSTGDPTEPSTGDPTEPSTGESTEPSNNLGDNYVTQIKDYIFYDNSETKWENVYAHWWNDDYTKIVDLENNLWPVGPLDENGNQDFGNAWPGTKMTKIEGTDIWQARVPFGATKIIFNNGKLDTEITKDVIPDEQVAALANGEITIENMLTAGVGMQTTDLPFDSELNAGQIYKVDTATAPTSARGNYKNRKWTFGAGAWTAYTGEYVSETLNKKDIQVSGDPSVDPSEASVDDNNVSSTPNNNGGVSNNNNNNGGNGASNPIVATGDTAVPAVFAVIALAALGVALAAFKKKERA